MAAKKYYLFFTLFLIVVLCTNLINVQSARADDGTPTEPPAATQVATEPPTVPPAPPPTQPPTEAPTEPPIESTPDPVESTPDPVEATATPVAEILTQVPDGTEVVVLDESGDALPLATPEAAEIMEETDPMWCPSGVLPGGAGCSSNFGSINALISNMGSNTSFYTQNGIIYFTSTAGGSLTITTSTLTGGDFSALNGFNLILQGGWNGSTASPSFSGQTNFANNVITIGTSGNPWVGNITLNDFTFSGGDQPNVNIVTSSGSITLSNVDVLNHQNGTNTAILNSTSGNITVQNGSTFDGNGSDSNGFVATTGSGSISVSNTSFTDAVRNGNNTYDGATLSAPTVTLTNVTATGNDGDGITVNNANVVTLANVTASNNGTESGPNGLANNDGSGVFINGNSGSRVIITGGTFNNNQEYGVEVGNPANTTIYIQANPACTGNDSNAAGLGCYNDTTVFDNTAPVITPNISGTAGSNGWYRSNVSVSWTVTDAESGVNALTGCTNSSLTSETSGTTLNCSAFNNAGLLSSASVTIKIDKTNPLISFLSRTAPNGNGWNNTDVSVNWSCSDALSGPVAANVSQAVTSEGAGQSSTGTCADNAGNTASNTQSGINIDKTAPSLTLPADMLVEATSASGAIVNYSASGTDNLDGTVVLNCSPASGLAFGFGTATVDCSSTDQAGNTATGSFHVTVQDTTGPLIASHTDEIAEATSPSGAVVNYTSPATSDLVDGSGVAACSPLSGITFPLGNTTITCTATDAHGNAATPLTFAVHVVDTTAPVIAAHADETAEATSASGAVVGYTSPSTSDLVDGSGTASCSPISGTLFALGKTTVTCNATDTHGNVAASTTFVVHVVDTTAPVIAAHADVTAEATSSSGAIVSYTDPSTSDAVDGTGTATCSPASGTTFALGDTTVTCNAMDTQGNLATPISFAIHVLDTTAPTLNLPGNITANATSPAGAIVTYSASASDIVDGSIPVSCDHASGSTFPLGATTVHCSATDEHGNSDSGSFIVNVQDPDAPTLDLPGNMTVEATGPAGAAVSYSASATDVVDGSVPVSCDHASGSTFPLGTTTVDCSATDSSGNTNNAAFLVAVADTTAPAIAPHTAVNTTTSDSSGAAVNYSSPTTTDAVDGAGTALCLPASGSLFPIGDTQVICTATDSHNNTATSTFFVHVALAKPSPGPTPRSSASGDSDVLIPVTSGGPIDLDCDTTLWKFGIKLSFLNLCDQQAAIQNVGAKDLPAGLPDGFSFVMGLNLEILTNGQKIEDLPDRAGVEMDFPLYNQSQDQFAVLYWDGAGADGKGEWIEVSKSLPANEISTALRGGDNLYHLITTSASQLFYQTLTTDKTGIFILVKK